MENIDTENVTQATESAAQRGLSRDLPPQFFSFATPHPEENSNKHQI